MPANDRRGFPGSVTVDDGGLRRPALGGQPTIPIAVPLAPWEVAQDPFPYEPGGSRDLSWRRPTGRDDDPFGYGWVDDSSGRFGIGDSVSDLVGLLGGTLGPSNVDLGFLGPSLEGTGILSGGALVSDDPKGTAGAVLGTTTQAGSAAASSVGGSVAPPGTTRDTAGEGNSEGSGHLSRDGAPTEAPDPEASHEGGYSYEDKAGGHEAWIEKEHSRTGTVVTPGGIDWHYPNPEGDDSQAWGPAAGGWRELGWRTVLGDPAFAGTWIHGGSPSMPAVDGSGMIGPDHTSVTDHSGSGYVPTTYDPGNVDPSPLGDDGGIHGHSNFGMERPDMPANQPGGDPATPGGR